MSLWRSQILRDGIAILAFLPMLFVTLPPTGVCLRQMLTSADCCNAVEMEADQDNPCCAACPLHDNDEPVPGPAKQTDGGTCLVSGGDLYLSPEKTTNLHNTRMFTVEHFAAPGVAILGECPQQCSSCAVAVATFKLTPNLRRGSSVLRV